MSYIGYVLLQTQQQYSSSSTYSTYVRRHDCSIAAAAVVRTELLHPRPRAPRAPPTHIGGSASRPSPRATHPAVTPPSFLRCGRLWRAKSLAKPLSDVEPGHGRHDRLLSASSQYPTRPAGEAPTRVECTGARRGQRTERKAHRNARFHDHHHGLVCFVSDFCGVDFTPSPCTVKIQ